MTPASRVQERGRQAFVDRIMGWLPFMDHRSGNQTARRVGRLPVYLLALLGGLAVGLLTPVSPWIALVLGLGIIILVLALSRPIILCYLMIAAVALLSGTARGRLVPMLEPNEATLLLSAYIVILVLLARRRHGVPIPGYFYAAFAALVGGTVVIPVFVYLLQGTQLTFSNSFKMVAPVQYFLLAWLFLVVPESAKERRGLIYWMMGLGAVVAVVGILQALRVGFILNILENWYPSSHLEMAASAGRVTSLLGAWNSLGIFMMVTFLIGWAVLPEVRRPGVRAGMMAVMALSFVCLLASGSYAGIAGLALGVLLIQLIAKRRTQISPSIILGFGVVIIALIVFEPVLMPMIEKRLAYQYRFGGIIPQTLVYRFTVWDQIFIPVILQHFPWPVYPSIPGYFSWGYEESQYILLLFQTGLSGLLGHLVWVAASVVWLSRNQRASIGFPRMMAIAAMTIILVLSVTGLTNEVFSFAGSADYLWILLAVVGGGKEKQE